MHWLALTKMGPYSKVLLNQPSVVMPSITLWMWIYTVEGFLLWVFYGIGRMCLIKIQAVPRLVKLWLTDCLWKGLGHCCIIRTADTSSPWHQHIFASVLYQLWKTWAFPKKWEESMFYGSVRTERRICNSICVQINTNLVVWLGYHSGWSFRNFNVGVLTSFTPCGQRV